MATAKRTSTSQRSKKPYQDSEFDADDAVGSVGEDGVTTNKRKVSDGDELDSLHGDYRAILNPPLHSSGSVAMDAVLGGGFPEGVFVEFVSDSGLGKTTACLFSLLGFSKRGMRTVVLDLEHGINDSQLTGTGLAAHVYHKETNPQGLCHIFQPKHIEAADVIMTKLIHLQNPPKIIIIDSITAMIPRNFVDKPLEEINHFEDSKLKQAFLLKYKGACKELGITVIFINQLRTKFKGRFIATEDSAGGFAVKYYCDIRLRMRKKADLKRTLVSFGSGGKGVETPYGVIVNIWSVKSRYAPPFISVPMNVIFGRGVSNTAAYRDYLTGRGFLTQGGAWYTLNFPGTEPQRFQGKDKVDAWVKTNVKLIKAQIVADGGLLVIGQEESPADEDEAALRVQSSAPTAAPAASEDSLANLPEDLPTSDE